MQLAEINVATLRAPLDDPMIADFVAGIAPLNELAEQAPGFVWRLVDPPARVDIVVVGASPFDPRVVINMSVWESLEALRAFTYSGAHLEFIKRRREWFSRMDVFLAMWWVPEGERPTVAQGRARLRLLERNGSTARAFTFSSTFAADGSPSAPRQWPPHKPRK